MSFRVNEKEAVVPYYGTKLVRSKKSYNIPEEYKTTLQSIAKNQKQKDKEKK